ncbi:MAG TPA: four helix bundle protein [Anaerolineales bacterium]|nr:four helix bundle protein [Anaerolineales bacterium]
MATVEQFEDLEVWQNARKLTNLIYDYSDVGSFSRDFGLRDQMRRASVSVMSNIAEGFESRTQALFIEYLGRAKGSAGELRAQLYIAPDRKYITKDQFRDAHLLAAMCSRQLQTFIQYLESQPNARRIREEQAAYEIKPVTFNLQPETQNEPSTFNLRLER